MILNANQSLHSSVSTFAYCMNCMNNNASQVMLVTTQHLINL